MTETLVIGAGFGGLSAALTLAARGERVRVLEAGPRAGGKAGTASLDGVEVDTGPSVLTLPEVFDGLFRLAGSSLAREVTLIAPEPAFRYLWPDGTRVDVHHEVDRTLDSVRASLGRPAAADLRDFLAYARRIWEHAAPHFVFGDAPSVGTLFRLGLTGVRALRHIDPMRAMWASIADRVRSPHLRDLLSRYATYNGSDVFRAPATLNCIAHVELALGGWGVERGIHALVRRLEAAARGLGVAFEYGVRVEGIRVSGGRVEGVELGDGLFVPARAVVCNADVAHLAGDLLPPTLRHGLPEGQEPSMSGWTGILRAQIRPGADRVAHTVLFPREYGEEFRDIFERDRPPREPTVYLCSQRLTHRRDTWRHADGSRSEPVFLMANAPAEPADGPRDPAAWDGLREAVLSRLHGAGLAHEGDALAWERTPTDLARQLPGTRGALYGPSSSSRFAAFQRAPNRVDRVPGLYVASGSGHPGGGMPLCAQAGRLAADALLADLGRAPSLASRAALAAGVAT